MKVCIDPAYMLYQKTKILTIDGKRIELQLVSILII